MVNVIKLDKKQAKFRIRELQNISKCWLGNEGTYSLEKWKDFCKCCEIYTYIEHNSIIGFLVTAPVSIVECDGLYECLEKYNLDSHKVMHIMLFAVSPEYRKRGIGTQLFNMMYTESDYKNIIGYVLAMRKHNEVAKRFYFKQNFIDSGTICDSEYENPPDDQIILIKKLIT